MRSYTVTFSATWIDRLGVSWSSGKQARTVKAQSRAAAVLQVRGGWPEGAQGTCTAEPEHQALLERVRINQFHGRPASTWDEGFPDELVNMELVTGWKN